MPQPPVAGPPRLHGLSQRAIQQVVASASALELGHAIEAERHLVPVALQYPDHAEILRLRAGIASALGRHREAIDDVHAAVTKRPIDALYVHTLGAVLSAAGEIDAAIDAFRRATALDPQMTSAWSNLGIVLTRAVRHDEALAALRHAVELAPEHAPARAQLADMLRVAGHHDEAAAEYRRVIAAHPTAGMAWWGLADLKTLRFNPADIAQMHAALATPQLRDDDAIAIGFALAKALDDVGRYRDSLAALAVANAIARRRLTWDASALSAQISAIHAGFTPLPVGSRVPLGEQVVFIVSMPRSGSTLVEQILASHPQVEGAGELADLPQVLAEESRRRGIPFPDWVGAMRADDWERLGRRYLERTARWTTKRRKFTDKLPNNWFYIDAIRAMLPAARLIACRRDPLETCLSCYRQLFDGNDYTRNFEDLAAFWRDFDRSVRRALTLHSGAVRENVLEALVAEPDAQIRALLDFCDLPFDLACMDFHLTKRDVRSPSAMQVRQPLRRDTARAARYGALLDPLRKALGMVPFARSTTQSERAWLEQVQQLALRGDTAAMAARLSSALAEYPDSIELTRAQAGVELQLGQRDCAAARLSKILADYPDDAASAFLLARILRDDGHASAAATVLHACFAHGEHDVELAIQAIELADACDAKRDAADIAERALLRSPDDARLHAYAAMLKLQLGAFDDARQHYLFALEHAPQACEWHVPHGLASTQRYRDAGHADFARLRECLDRTDLSERARSTLLFALGKMHDDVGDYAQAADFFRDANAIARALTRWSRADWQCATESILAAPPIIEHLDAPSDFVPIFIVGMPRSGTTLTAELLGRRAHVVNRGERTVLPKLAPALIAQHSHADLERAAALCTRDLRGEDRTSRWFIDKQPLNFRYVGLILALMPNARIVHCQRNPRDTALSLWMQSFEEDLQGYAYDFADIDIVMRDDERLMAHWRAAHGTSIRSIAYEQLAGDPDGTIGELAQWLQLPALDSASMPPKTSTSISTASVWQVRQPVYTRAIGRWRKYVDSVPELLQFPA